MHKRYVPTADEALELVLRDDIIRHYFGELSRSELHPSRFTFWQKILNAISLDLSRPQGERVASLLRQSQERLKTLVNTPKAKPARRKAAKVDWTKELFSSQDLKSAQERIAVLEQRLRKLDEMMLLWLYRAEGRRRSVQAANEVTEIRLVPS